MGAVLPLLQLVLGGAFGQMAPVAAQMLRATLLQPYTLGPVVAAAWSVARDVALSALGCVLAYGAVRAMLAGDRPWDLLARAALAGAGAQLSLDLVTWMLQVNNQLVAALAGPAGAGAEQALLLPLGALAGSGLDLLPAAVGIVVVAGAIWVAVTYFLRAAEIVVLAMVAPFAAVVALVPAGGGVWRALVAELVPAVFMQAGQALVLWAFVGVAAPAGGPAGLAQLFTALAALTLLGRVRGLLRTLCRAPAGSGGAAIPWFLLARLVPSAGTARRLAGGV